MKIDDKVIQACPGGEKWLGGGVAVDFVLIPPINPLVSCNTNVNGRGWIKTKSRNPRESAKVMGVVNKVYNFSAFTHAQNFAVQSWWTYQIDLSKSTKQNIVVILQAQHKNLNMHGTRLAGSFPASVHACLSSLLNHTNVQQETVLTCIGWPNFFQFSVHVHPCGL